MRNVAHISIKNSTTLLGLNHLATIDYRPTTNCFYICREGSTNQPQIMRNKPNLCLFWAVSDDCEEKQTQSKPNKPNLSCVALAKKDQTQFQTFCWECHTEKIMLFDYLYWSQLNFPVYPRVSNLKITNSGFIRGHLLPLRV